MPAIVIVVLLLLYLPYRISRGFPATIRVSILLIVAIKAIILMVLHFDAIDTWGQPIVLDESVDAKRYYDVGQAFESYRLWDITYDEIVRERGASSHVGYYVVNVAAFRICPAYPILFLRLAKLLLFHVGLGMLAGTWRLRSTSTRAFVAYLFLGVLSYQIFYYIFRNLKDDLVLSLFMMIMALADRHIDASSLGSEKTSRRRMILVWVAIGLLAWVISTIRFYLGMGILCAFAMHTVTRRGMKMTYRVALAVAIAGGFLVLTTRSGYSLVEERGAVSAVTSGIGNVYGLFKFFVTPLPWQHVRPWLAVPHSFYLLLLAPALWALLARFRSNLDWKLYIVILLMIIVGGYIQDYGPRKRYVIYPIFVGWIVTARRRIESPPAESEPFDANAYFAQRRDVLT